MAWKTSCKDVATRVRVGRFALHIFCLGFVAPLPPANDAPAACLYPYKLESLRYISGAGSMGLSLYLHSNFSDGLQNAGV